MAATVDGSSWLSSHLDDAFGIDTAIRSSYESLLDRYPKFVVTIVLPYIAVLLQYAACSAFMYVLENVIDWSWLHKYKIQKNKKSSAELNWKATKLLTYTYLVIILPLYMFGFYFVFTKIGLSTEPEDIPHWYQAAVQIAFCAFMEDFSHYWVHRWLHTEWAYRKIHAVHHEFTVTSTLCAAYAHPVEVIVEGIAAFSGPLLIQPHFIVMLTWILLRQGLAMETHCGYDFPFSPNNILPFFGGADFHDFHHRTFNGVYSSNFIWWDVLFGTDKGYFAAKQKLAKKKLERKAAKPEAAEEAAAASAEPGAGADKKAQ